MTILHPTRSLLASRLSTPASSSTAIFLPISGVASVAPSTRRPTTPSTSYRSIVSSSQQSPPPQQSDLLTWDQYLKLRRSKRLAGLATSIPSTLFAAGGAGSYFLSQEIDPSQTIAGIEPLYVYGALTIACTGLGYLIGPMIGSTLWSLLHRNKLKQMEVKDAEFYEHIKKRRVDPSRSNMQNPIPDFYGEKISSLKEYRRWLRDCSVYRRKAAHGLQQVGGG